MADLGVTFSWHLAKPVERMPKVKQKTSGDVRVQNSATIFCIHRVAAHASSDEIMNFCCSLQAPKRKPISEENQANSLFPAIPPCKTTCKFSPFGQQ